MEVLSSLSKRINGFDEAKLRVSAEVERLLTAYRTVLETGGEEPMAGGAQSLLSRPKDSLPEYPTECITSTNQLPRPLNIDSLPIQLKLAILSWLSGEELGRLCGVSRSWRRLACDESLWRRLLSQALERWDRVSSDRDPAAYRAACPHLSSKLIYTRCRPEKDAESSWGAGFGAFVTFVTGHKPRVLMFGPGLDSRTSKLVRSILSDPAPSGTGARFSVTGMVPGEFAGMGSGISLRFAEHQLNLITLYSNTKSVRQNLQGHNRVQENKLFTSAGAVFEVAPSIQELCRRSQAFVFVVDATKSAEEISSAWEELSAMCCPLWTGPNVPLLVLACSRGDWSPAWAGPDPRPPAHIAKLLRLGRLNRRWLVQAGEVETLHGVRSGFQWLMGSLNPVHSLAHHR